MEREVTEFQETGEDVKSGAFLNIRSEPLVAVFLRCDLKKGAAR